jgi:glycosyltransferase A (GT-A) superfamily protein (DUF2064 family)
MSPVDCTLLVMAKAPVSGQAKTRLAPAFGADGAAEIAAAALLDTLDAVGLTDVTNHVVALSGDLDLASGGTGIARVLEDFIVVPQYGATFSDRLVRAHGDAARLGCPVLQIGMDTPQVVGDLLTRSAEMLLGEGVDAVLGPAADGGWWALGLSDPAAASVLTDIPMSRDDTGILTRAALVDRGCLITELPVLTDVDTPEDARVVAAAMSPASRFRRTVEALDTRSRTPRSFR